MPVLGDTGPSGLLRPRASQAQSIRGLTLFDIGEGGSPTFVKLLTSSGAVGDAVRIIGHGFSDASSVSFNGTPASFHVVSDTLLITYVPSGETGFVRVNLPQGADDALTVFRVTPQITGFSPATGMVGDAVTVTGNGLIQTDAIAVGGSVRPPSPSIRTPR